MYLYLESTNVESLNQCYVAAARRPSRTVSQSLLDADPREPSRSLTLAKENLKVFASLFHPISTPLTAATMASTASKDSFTFTVGKLGTLCRAFCEA